MKSEINTTKEKTYTTNDIEVILKRIDKRFDDTIELLTENTDKKFDKFKSEVGAMIESVDTSIKLLAESMDTKFGSVNERLDRVEKKVDRLQDDVVEVKFELRQKVSVDQFQRLERRVTKLERLSLSH